MAKLLRLVVNALMAPARAGAFAAPAAADDYPSRSIRLIIPFAPGGSNDVVGRIIANQLGQKLGQQVFVDNRPGAGGVVGSDLAAKADARRLYALDHFHRACGRSLALQGAVRPDQGFRPGQHSRHRHQCAHRQSESAGPFGEGIARSRQGEAGRPELRLRRHRQLPESQRRIVQADGRRRTSCTCHTKAADRPCSPSSPAKTR